MRIINPRRMLPLLAAGVLLVCQALAAGVFVAGWS
jgi:hypothetical protein